MIFYNKTNIGLLVNKKSLMSITETEPYNTLLLNKEYAFEYLSL